MSTDRTFRRYASCIGFRNFSPGAGFNRYPKHPRGRGSRSPIKLKGRKMKIVRRELLYLAGGAAALPSERPQTSPHPTRHRLTRGGIASCRTPAPPASRGCPFSSAAYPRFRGTCSASSPAEQGLLMVLPGAMLLPLGPDGAILNPHRFLIRRSFEGAWIQWIRI
jgi:hypothetical protein